MSRSRRLRAWFLTETRPLDALALLGLIALVAGSIAIWVSGPLQSASGLKGGGKITLALAVVAAFGVISGPVGRVLGSLMSLAAFGVALYELLHLHSRLGGGAVLYGVHSGQLGWGLYLTAAGALLACLAAAAAFVVWGLGRDIPVRDAWPPRP
jgi:hypothetical protein